MYAYAAKKVRPLEATADGFEVEFSRWHSRKRDRWCNGIGVGVVSKTEREAGSTHRRAAHFQRIQKVPRSERVVFAGASGASVPFVNADLDWQIRLAFLSGDGTQVWVMHHFECVDYCDGRRNRTAPPAWMG